MPQILRTTLVPDATPAADGTVTYSLPVNPISAILLTVKALNETSTLTAYSYVSALLAMVTNLNVKYRGATIVDGSLTDLAVIFACLARWFPFSLNNESEDNQVRSLTVPILFGRTPYSPTECFPASRSGDLILSLTEDIAVAGADGLIIQAETIELLDANPERFTKITTQTPAAFTAGSGNYVDLPIGNKLLGFLLRGFNVPDAADYQSSFGQVALQVDNVEVGYSETNWETLHGELARKMGLSHNLNAHYHTTDTADAATTYTDSLQQEDDGSLLNNYAFLDLDPLGDGTFSLDTRNAAQVRLKVTADATDATASRVLPIELVEIGGAAGQA